MAKAEPPRAEASAAGLEPATLRLAGVGQGIDGSDALREATAVRHRLPTHGGRRRALGDRTGRAPGSTNSAEHGPARTVTSSPSSTARWPLGQRRNCTSSTNAVWRRL